MSLNSVGSSLQSPHSEYQFQNRPQKNGNSTDLSQRKYSIDARMVSEYYSSNSLSFEYTSKDGDTVSFSMESVEYSKSIMDVSAEGSKDDMKKLIDFIKGSYDQMKKDILKGFLRSVGAEVPEEEEVNKAKPTKELQIPEYWNAENTSQRIVDFAVSFSGLFEGSGDEFLDMIKNAIDEGFKQAREMLGNLPDEVSGLIDDTYKLVMEKLDSWGNGQNIANTVPLENAA
jgi:hypothetical protein